jgi:hypothetical protein
VIAHAACFGFERLGHAAVKIPFGVRMCRNMPLDRDAHPAQRHEGRETFAVARGVLPALALFQSIGPGVRACRFFHR